MAEVIDISNGFLIKISINPKPISRKADRISIFAASFGNEVCTIYIIHIIFDLTIIRLYIGCIDINRCHCRLKQCLTLRTSLGIIIEINSVTIVACN